MSEMFRVGVMKVTRSSAELRVTQRHPDCNQLATVLDKDILTLVGTPAFRYEQGQYLPDCPLGEALGSFDALFDDQNARQVFEHYFPRSSVQVAREIYRDEDLEAAMLARGIEPDTDEWDDAEAEVRDEIRGEMTIQIEASDPRWLEHFTVGRSWDI